MSGTADGAPLDGPYGEDLRELPRGRLFLYLKESSHAEVWLTGGVVPFYPARKYLSDDRKGILTPDEILQESSQGLNRTDLAMNGIIFCPTGGVRNLRITGINGDGGPIPDTRIDSYYEEAALFCCSATLSKKQMMLFEKTIAIEILEMSKLIALIEAKIGDQSRYGYVQYTGSLNRSHFLKSREDEWQSEYRIVIPWDEQQPIHVELPEGICQRVDYLPDE